MTLRYRETARLSKIHTKGISCLAFSPDGIYIASGGLDGKMCVWSVKTSKVLHVVTGSCAVLSLIWPSQDQFHCGMQDGTIVSVSITPVMLSVDGYRAHNFPVERISLSHSRKLASGGHQELKVWTVNEEERFTWEATIDDPPTTSMNQHLEILITGLHWTGSNKRLTLLVTYMFHGIIFIDGNSWTRLRIIPPYAGCIADSSLSEDSRHLAVSNMVTGFDIYAVDSGNQEQITSAPLRHEMGEKYPTPVRFVHGSHALLTGSATGDPRLWSLNDKSETQQILHVQKESKILAVAAHHYLDSRDPSKDRFIVATGISAAGENPGVVVLWKAQQLDVGYQHGTHILITTSKIIGRALQFVVVLVAVWILLRDIRESSHVWKGV